MDVKDVITHLAEPFLTSDWVPEESFIETAKNPIFDYRFNYKYSKSNPFKLVGYSVHELYAFERNGLPIAIYLAIEFDEQLIDKITDEFGCAPIVLGMDPNIGVFSAFQWSWKYLGYNIHLRKLPSNPRKDSIFFRPYDVLIITKFDIEEYSSY